jgi:hypothetical protein
VLQDLRGFKSPPPIGERGWIVALLFLVMLGPCWPAWVVAAPLQDSRSIDEAPGKVVVLGHLYGFLAVRSEGKTGYPDLEALELLVGEIEKIDGVAAIIIAGDLVIQGLPEEYERLRRHFFAKFDVPFYYIAANHESRQLGPFEAYAEKVPYRTGNRSVRIGGMKYTIFSAWKSSQGSDGAETTVSSQLDTADLRFLKGAIAPDSTASEKHDDVEKHVLISADYRVFDDPRWNRQIQPLIDRHIDYVVIGDNESTQHRYGWIERADVPYIFQGMTQPGRWGGIGTFLTIENSGASTEIKVHTIHTPNALSKAYRFSGKGGPERRKEK